MRKNSSNIALIIVVVFITGFICGCIGSTLYIVCQDISKRGEANQSFIEDYINNENEQKEESTKEDFFEYKPNIVGTSTKDVENLEINTVPIADGIYYEINEDVKFEEYAISFTNKYMNNKTTGVIINRNNDTAIQITNGDAYIGVSVFKYSAEKFDPFEIFNGDCISDFFINLETKNIENMVSLTGFVGE